MFKNIFPKYRYRWDEIWELYFIEKRIMFFFWIYSYGPTFLSEKLAIEFVKKVNNAS